MNELIRSRVVKAAVSATAERLELPPTPYDADDWHRIVSIENRDGTATHARLYVRRGDTYYYYEDDVITAADFVYTFASQPVTGPGEVLGVEVVGATATHVQVLTVETLRFPVGQAVTGVM